MGLLLISLMFGSQTTQASFTDDLTIGNATALGLAHAVTADPSNIDSIHFNPAGLTRLKGRQMFLKGIAGIFSVDYEFGEYGDHQQELIDSYLPFAEDEHFFYDDAHNTTSTTEGPSVMLPGEGLVNLPVSFGVMGGASYSPPGSKYTFATNVYTPLMFGIHRAKDDPGRYFGQSVGLTLITYFSPSIAYKASDELSLGISFNLSYSGMGLDLPAREPHPAIFWINGPFIKDNFCEADGTPIDEQFDLCGTIPPYTIYGNLSFEASQADALGFNLGLLWSPEPWVTFGLSYNSRINTDMDGTYSFPIDPNFKQFMLDFMEGGVYQAALQAGHILGSDLPTVDEVRNNVSGKINIKYEIPQRLNAGISLQLTPKWKYNLDAKWTEWSVFGMDMRFSDYVPLLGVAAVVDEIGTGGQNGITPYSVHYPLGLEDTIDWAMGTEYKFTDQITLRGGAQYRPSVVPKSRPNAFIPMNSGYLYSLGFSYETQSKSKWDFGMGYFHTKQHFPPCSAQMGNGCDQNNVVYPVYQGQDIKSEVTFLLFEILYSKHF